MLQNPHVLLTVDKIHNLVLLPRETTSDPPKVVRTPSAFNILTWKCASRHNGVHFFNISTAKSGPNLLCFVHFDLEMCVLTWKCASRHNGVRFFNISTAKSGPNLVCFVHV